MTERHANTAGLNLIKRFEGYRGRAYRCAAGRWTVGWGHTRTAHPGMSVTLEQADALLREDVKDAESAVSKLITVPLNDNEFGALVSLVFNIGQGAFRTSTLRRVLNAGDRQEAAKQFLVWTKAGSRVLDGLVRRRAAERALFLEPVSGG